MFPSRIEAVTTFAIADAQGLLGDATPASAEQRNALFAQLAPRLDPLWWTFSSRGKPLTPQRSKAVVIDGNVVFTQELLLPADPEVCFSTRVFAALPPGHRQHFTLKDSRGKIVAARLLSQADAQWTGAYSNSNDAATGAAMSGAPAVSFVSFFGLGLEHILTGYDHLLFLLAFLIAARETATVFKIVTSFTVAHSLTLGLSAFNLVSLPVRWVEPAIAITIVFVAVQNLTKRDRPSDRVWLTFLFGLIHGFGFASVLRGMGIAALGTSSWRALAGFNLGVEVGQVAVAGVVLPLLWRLRRQPQYERSWQPLLSSGIAMAGLYWFIQRIGAA